jgi:hypothetical protein
MYKLKFRVVTLGEDRYLLVETDDMQDSKIAFPTRHPAYVVAGGGRWTLMGIQIDDGGTEKPQLWDFENIIVLGKGMSLGLRIHPTLEGVVVIDVRDSYTEDVVKYASRNGVHLWTGKMQLGMAD